MRKQKRQKQKNLSKVEFFSSASSFQSSLNRTNLLDTAQQIAHQTNLIFASLKKELQSNYSQSVQTKIQSIINRAQILYHYTIPQQIESEENLNIETSKMTLENYEKINALLSDFKKLQSKQLSYQQFYQKYRQSQINSKSNLRMDSQEIKITVQQQVQIYHHYSPKTYKNKGENTASRVGQSNGFKQSRIFRNKIDNEDTNKKIIKANQEIYTLKTQNKLIVQKVHLLKKEILQLKALNFKQLNEEKLNFCHRLQKIINLKFQNLYKLSKKSKQYQQCKNESIDILKDQILRITKDLTQNIEFNNRKQQDLFELKKLNRNLHFENENLKQEQQRNHIHQQKSAQMRVLHFQQIQNQIRSSGYQIKQQQTFMNLLKKCRILQDQNRLLRSQLSLARQIISKQNFIKQSQRLIQTKLLKEGMITKNKEINCLQYQLDQVKVLLNRLVQQHSHCEQQFRRLKIRNLDYQQTLKQSRISKTLIQQNNHQNISPTKSKQHMIANSKSKQLFINRGPKVQLYVGEVIEGFVYYKCLQKQFRYRYRRACLKSKQMLYKKEGFQIGVISKLKSSNNLKSKNDILQMTIFLTNYSDQHINNMKISFINSNRHNQVRNQNQNQTCNLKPGDQVKWVVNYKVSKYPIGSLIMCIDTKKQLRLLLPINIRHFFTFQQSQKAVEFLKKQSNQQIKFNCEKKVFKDFLTLCEYLDIQNKNSNIGKVKSNKNNQINFKAQHVHTETQAFFTVKFFEMQQTIQINYHVLKGSSEIVDYLVKNLKFLLQKQSKT